MSKRMKKNLRERKIVMERDKMTLIYHHDDKCKWEHEEALVVPTLDVT
jgi:hypothetical protein